MGNSNKKSKLPEPSAPEWEQPTIAALPVKKAPEVPYIPRPQRVRETVERVVRARLGEREFRSNRSKPWRDWITEQVRASDDLEAEANSCCDRLIVRRMHKAVEAARAAGSAVRKIEAEYDEAAKAIARAHARRGALSEAIEAHRGMVAVLPEDHLVEIAQRRIELAGFWREYAEIDTRPEEAVVNRAQAAVDAYCAAVKDRNHWAELTRDARFKRQHAEDLDAARRVPEKMHHLLPEHDDAPPPYQD